MDDLIRMSKKAAEVWENTDGYKQAAILINLLCERIEKMEIEIKTLKGEL